MSVEKECERIENKILAMASKVDLGAVEEPIFEIPEQYLPIAGKYISDEFKQLYIVYSELSYKAEKVDHCPLDKIEEDVSCKACGCEFVNTDCAVRECGVALIMCIDKIEDELDFDGVNCFVVGKGWQVAIVSKDECEDIVRNFGDGYTDTNEEEEW